ncbi:MAG: lamin tail domain-containing protein [Phycisphaerales bacterium]|nr:lamin tail domain-containing protein [Phycisphaerales bacterium]
MKLTIAIAALAGIAGAANASVTINEVLGSTSGSDAEFIELYNTTGADIDLTGWSIELWDSDFDTAGFGQEDGGSTFMLSGVIGAGGHHTLGNALSQSTYGYVADQLIGANSIENGSYTMVLRDAGSAIVETFFVTDSDLDVANIGGTPITPDFAFGPDGSFLPAGFYRIGDGSSNIGLLEFGQPSPSATPDAANIPAPGALALLGLGGLATTRRRR